MLIAAAKEKDPGLPVRRRDPGCTFEEARATAGAGFDYLFNSFAWWDLKKPWALEQYERLRVLAPSIAFPENHDMPASPPGSAGQGGGRRAVAHPLRARRLLLGRRADADRLRMGLPPALHVVETHPGDREHDTGIDISDAIRAINALKAELPAANVEGRRCASRRRCGLRRPRPLRHRPPCLGGHAVLVLYNPTAPRCRWRPGRSSPARAGCSPLRGPHAGRRAHRLPRRQPCRPRAGGTAHPRREPRQRRPPALAREPEGEGRVVIEAVSPELDGGRSAVKRIVGEDVRVEADIFSDGHEIIAAAILAGRRHDGMARGPDGLRGQRPLGGPLPLERNARYEFTIDAWRDPFASWMRDTIKKRDAGVDVRLETIEGVTLVESAASLATGRDRDRLAALVAALGAEQAGPPPSSTRSFSRIPSPWCGPMRAGEPLALSVAIPVIADRLAARSRPGTRSSRARSRWT